jgi:hypothetical protein
MHFLTLVQARAGVLSPLVCNNGFICGIRLFRLFVCRERLNQFLRRFLVSVRSVRLVGCEDSRTAGSLQHLSTRSAFIHPFPRSRRAT